MNSFTDLASGLFEWVLQTSWQAAVLVGMILLVQQLFRKRLSAGWRYGLWMLLVLRLLMPATPDSAFSVFNAARLATGTPTMERGLGQLPVLEAMLPSAEPTTAAAALFLPRENASGTPAQSPAAWSALEVRRDKPIALEGVGAVTPGAARKTSIDWLNVGFGLWLGGIGRPVTGRIKVKNPYVEIEWQKGHYRAHTVHPPRPANVGTPEEFKAWRQREDVERAFDSIRSHPIFFSEDGSFRIEEMLPGQYQFWIWIHDPRDPDAFARSLYIARFNDTFEIPDTDQRFTREPLDIGEFELSLNPQIEAGKTAAPEFTALDMEGNEFKLADFKGKYVLLDFWATWCGPCIAELPYLREAHKQFGGRDDFVMISLSLDDAVEKPREFVTKNDMPWLQGYLGDWANTDVPREYGVDGIPALFLIDPEGRMIARGLRGGTVNTELSKWLK
jgi:thiol-disulfide isomerase/thioredoxin